MNKKSMVGLLVVGLGLLAGCRRESVAVGTTSLTSASVVGRDEAVTRIADVQCRRELECAASDGFATPFNRKQDCVHATTERLKERMSCGYVEPRRLGACVERLQRAICDATPQSGAALEGCRGGDLCAPDPEPEPGEGG